jgi:hypothetical protein
VHTAAILRESKNLLQARTNEARKCFVRYVFVFVALPPSGVVLYLGESPTASQVSQTECVCHLRRTPGIGSTWIPGVSELHESVIRENNKYRICASEFVGLFVWFVEFWLARLSWLFCASGLYVNWIGSHFPSHFLLRFASGNDQVDIANVMARVFCLSFGCLVKLKRWFAPRKCDRIGLGVFPEPFSVAFCLIESPCYFR